MPRRVRHIRPALVPLDSAELERASGGFRVSIAHHGVSIGSKRAGLSLFEDGRAVHFAGTPVGTVNVLSKEAIEYGQAFTLADWTSADGDHRKVWGQAEVTSKDDLQTFKVTRSQSTDVTVDDAGEQIVTTRTHGESVLKLDTRPSELGFKLASTHLREEIERGDEKITTEVGKVEVGAIHHPDELYYGANATIVGVQYETQLDGQTVGAGVSVGLGFELPIKRSDGVTEVSFPVKAVDVTVIGPDSLAESAYDRAKALFGDSQPTETWPSRPFFGGDAANAADAVDATGEAPIATWDDASQPSIDPPAQPDADPVTSDVGAWQEPEPAAWEPELQAEPPPPPWQDPAPALPPEDATSNL